MTMYFPLVVHGAMLIEPTETETKAASTSSSTVLRGIAERARAGDAAHFRAAPRLTPRRRLDETAAARKPVLRWRPEPEQEAGGGVGSCFGRWPIPSACRLRRSGGPGISR